MKLIRLKSLVLAIVFGTAWSNLSAQNFSFNCSRDTLIPGCPPNLCFTLEAPIPDIKGLSDSYTLNPGSFTPGCFPVYVAPNDPAGNPITLNIDDRYSAVIPLSFPFTFYGTTYNSLVASTNGYVTFDLTRAGGFSHWTNNGDLPTASYDPLLIMGPYHDLDPSINPWENKIQHQEWGVAPTRRWVLSFYRVALYGCGSFVENTHQIILYESTGIIEVKIFDKRVCPSHNGGKAMVGIQDGTRTRGMTAPQRRMSDPPWGAVGMNETWRFVPNGGASLIKRVELLDMAGNIISTGTTAVAAPGVLRASFPNTCAPAGVTTSYQIRSVYQKNDDPNVEIFGLDTVRVNRNLPPPDATVVGSSTTCDGASDGTITVTSTMPGPYTFSLDGGPEIVGTVPFVFTNVAPGPHNVVVTGAARCLTTPPIPVDITVGPTLVTTASATDALCNGGSTGTITVAVPTMGTPPYEYSLDGINWQSSNVFTGLAANTYRVYYRTTNGCQNDLTIDVGEPAALTISNVVVPVTCNGGTDGTITVTAGGGTPNYEYSIDGGTNWQTSNVFTVGAGPYTVLIRDANGCTNSRTENVGEPAALSASSVNTNASCDGGDDGTITVTATGGNSGYEYSLDNVNWQTSNVFNVGPNNHTVYVRDSKGCTTSFPAPVGLTNNLTFTPMTDPTICEGSSVQLNLVSNATIYTWTPSGGLSNPNIANPVANPTVTTPYDVTATLGRCSIQDNVIVNVNPAPVPYAGENGFICYGQIYQLQGNGGVQYSWSPSKYLDDPLSATPVSTPRETITYTLSIVADVNGCPSLVPDDIIIDVTPPVKVYTYPSDTIAYPGDRIQLLAVSAVPQANMFTWTPGINLNNANVHNPVVTAGNVGDSLVYKVTATSAAGCAGDGYVRLRVYKGPDLYAPNAFTPNGDGRNETFYPFPVGIKAINYFRVFNRWGQLVFSSTALYKGWDGRFQGTDQGPGTYVWMAQGIDKDGKLITRQGTVTLIR